MRIIARKIKDIYRFGIRFGIRLAIRLAINCRKSQARAAANAIELVRKGQMQVFSLNEYLGNSKHRNIKPQIHTDTHESVCR